MFTQSEVQFVIDSHIAVGIKPPKLIEIDSVSREDDTIVVGDFYIQQLIEAVTNQFGVYTQYSYDVYEWLPDYNGVPDHVQNKVAHGLRSFEEALTAVFVEQYRWVVQKKIDRVDCRPSKVLEEQPF